MEYIKPIIDVTLNILNTKLIFGSFSFSLLEWFLATAILSIVIWFICHLFD